jgi:hypothetical protein
MTWSVTFWRVISSAVSTLGQRREARSQSTAFAVNGLAFGFHSRADTPGRIGTKTALRRG